MFPVLPLVNVSQAEFPVLIRIINAVEKSLSLLALRKMKEEFDDTGVVTMEMFLQVDDGTIPFLPDRFFAERFS
jgi:hypothetical protein